MSHQDRIQSWLVDIPELLLPLASESTCSAQPMARADSPLLGQMESMGKVQLYAPHCSSRYARDLGFDKPLPPRPTRTPSPPTPTLTSGNCSVDSSPNSDYPTSEYSLSHSRGSSATSAIFTGNHSPVSRAFDSHSRGLSTSVCAGHESLSRQASSSSNYRRSSSGANWLSPVAPPPSRKPSQARRSVSSRSLRPASRNEGTLTTASSFDNLKHANRTSIRNAVYIDGDEVERRLVDIALSQIPNSPNSISSSIPEDETADFASTASVPSSLDLPLLLSPKKKKKSVNAIIKSNPPQGDSLPHEFTFPLPTTGSASSPVAPAPPLSSDNFLDVDSDTEQNVASSPTKKKRSRRQRFVSFISRITSPSTTPSFNGVPLPPSPSSPSLHHISTPSSSTASSNYPVSMLSSSSFDKLNLGPEDFDPFGNVPTVILSTPTLVAAPSQPLSSPTPPLKPKTRARAVSLTSGTTFGSSKAAKITREGTIPAVPTLDIGRTSDVDLTCAPSQSQQTSPGVLFSLSPVAAAPSSVPSSPLSASFETPTVTTRFTQKLKGPFFSKPFSPSSSTLTSPSMPNLKKQPLHKRLSLNPILLSRSSSSNPMSPRGTNGSVFEHFLTK